MEKITMELNVNVNVNINVTEMAAQALQNFASIMATAMAQPVSISEPLKHVEAPEAPKAAKAPEKRPAKKVEAPKQDVQKAEPAPEPVKEEPAAAPAPEPAPEAEQEDADDTTTPTEAPAEGPSEEDRREAAKAEVAGVVHEKKAGKQVKALLDKYGAKKLSAVPLDKLDAFLADVRAL